MFKEWKEEIVCHPSFFTLIKNLVELKCQLWRKSVEKIVKNLTRDSFSIRNRADSWTETM